MADEQRPPWATALMLKMEETIEGMNKAGLAEWVELFRRPRRLLFLNFLSGIARGFGIAVGFTVIGALFLVLLGYLARLNIPIIGEFIADIVRIVRLELRGL